MRISDVLTSKPSQQVVTIGPDATVRELLGLLAEHNVGAVVVSGDDAVRAIMTSDVQTCDPHTSVDDLRVVMTEKRIRHVPVVTDGRLTGIISIGDVVKSSLDQLKFERDQLDSYVHQT